MGDIRSAPDAPTAGQNRALLKHAGKVLDTVARSMAADESATKKATASVT